MLITDEQINSLFEKHSTPNNDFEPVWLMNERQFAAAIREATEQASQSQTDKYRKALEFIADNADMRGEALASIAGEALNAI